MSKYDKIILISLILFSAGFFVFRSARSSDPPVILSKLPPSIERQNPVPMVRFWDEGKRTFYYFGWGEKPTGGYSLELIEVRNGLIRLRAVEPQPDLMVTQVLTYPSLLLSLPKGSYRYEVIDSRGYMKADVFKASRSPLELKLRIPSGGDEDRERRVWRDPYHGNEGKTTAHIALEALFVQDEMRDLAGGVQILGTSFDAKGWYILLSKEYDLLQKSQQQRLATLIEENVLALGVKNLNSVVITTNLADLPMIES